MILIMPTKQDELKEVDMFKDIDIDELIETTKLEILPKYETIKPKDTTTERIVKIVSLPKAKFIEKKADGSLLNKDLLFMTISDNSIVYSLSAESIALRRSLIALAMKLCNAEVKADIDMSVLIDKYAIIKRVEFTAKGFTQSPIQFFQYKK